MTKREHSVVSCSNAFATGTSALAIWMWVDVVVGRPPGFPELVVWLIWLGTLVWGTWDLRVGLFAPAVWRYQTSEPTLCLTFDDGPDPETTPAVLDALKAHHTRACFFLVGQKVDDHPELAKRIVEAGHDVGIHGYHHSWRPWLRLSVALNELERARDAVERATGHRPVIFRPPYGVSTPPMGKAVERLGLTVVGWSHRTLDTVHRDSDRWLARTLGALRPGHIVLLHDAPQSPGGRAPLGAVALSPLLEGLSALGLRAVGARDRLPWGPALR